MQEKAMDGVPRTLVVLVSTLAVAIVIALISAPAYGQNCEAIAAELPVGVVLEGETLRAYEECRHDVSWELDVSSTGSSPFKFFGNIVTEGQIGTLKAIRTKCEEGCEKESPDRSWETTLIVVQGMGRHKVGDIADYYDVIVLQNAMLSQRWSASWGAEVFHAPPQLGGEHTTFLAPQASVTFNQRSWLSWTFGIQIPLAIDTVYDGDIIFGYAETDLSVGWKRLTFSITPGVVFGDTGRLTGYADASVTVRLTNRFSMYASALASATRYNDGGSDEIPTTYTVGFTISR